MCSEMLIWPLSSSSVTDDDADGSFDRGVEVEDEADDEMAVVCPSNQFALVLFALPPRF